MANAPNDIDLLRAKRDRLVGLIQELREVARQPYPDDTSGLDELEKRILQAIADAFPNDEGPDLNIKLVGSTDELRPNNFKILNQANADSLEFRYVKQLDDLLSPPPEPPPASPAIKMLDRAIDEQSEIVRRFSHFSDATQHIIEEAVHRAALYFPFDSLDRGAMERWEMLPQRTRATLSVSDRARAIVSRNRQALRELIAFRKQALTQAQLEEVVPRAPLLPPSEPKPAKLATSDSVASDAQFGIEAQLKLETAKFGFGTAQLGLDTAVITNKTARWTRMNTVLAIALAIVGALGFWLKQQPDNTVQATPPPPALIEAKPGTRPLKTEATETPSLKSATTSSLPVTDEAPRPKVVEEKPRKRQGSGTAQNASGTNAVNIAIEGDILAPVTINQNQPTAAVPSEPKPKPDCVALQGHILAALRNQDFMVNYPQEVRSSDIGPFVQAHVAWEHAVCPAFRDDFVCGNFKLAREQPGAELGLPVVLTSLNGKYKAQVAFIERITQGEACR